MTAEREKLLCVICGGEAVYSFSPDLDVRGLGACESHRTEVQRAYEILVYMGEDSYEKFIKNCRKKSKNNNTRV